MPIPAVAVVAAALAGTGGLSLGALIRQPQINKLKAEVVRLQQELDHMQMLVKDTLKDIEILQLKMQLQQNEDLLDQLKGKGETQVGTLVYAYGLKEYMEVKEKYLLFDEDITEKQAVFVDSFAMYLDNRIPENDASIKQFIREYLYEKYGDEIEKLIVPDLLDVVCELEKQTKRKVQAEEKASENVTGATLIPELDSFSLNEEQTRFLYSLELLKIDYDIHATLKSEESSRKVVWKNEWMTSILKGIGKMDRANTYFIKDADTLYSQMKAAYDASVTKTWYHLVAFEAALFVPYFPMTEDKESQKLWKGLKFRSDYMKEEFCTHQTVVDKKLLEKMVHTYGKNMTILSGKTGKILKTIAITTVLTFATAGLASAFAPSIAVFLVGNSFASLSGQALVNASLAFIGGGSLAAGGLGVAGGTVIITGGGALLGMVGGASSVTAMTLLSSEGYTQRECAKLLAFSSVVLVDEFSMNATVCMLQRTVENRIAEFDADLKKIKSEKAADKKAVKAISTNIDYLKKCNKELEKLIKQKGA